MHNQDCIEFLNQLDAAIAGIDARLIAVNLFGVPQGTLDIVKATRQDLGHLRLRIQQRIALIPASDDKFPQT